MMRTIEILLENVRNVVLGWFGFKRWVVVAAMVSASIMQAEAGNKTWTNGGGTNNWGDASNWSGGLPGSGDVAIFGPTFTANCNINTHINVSGITIQSGYSGTLTQVTGDTINVNNNFSQSAGTFAGGNSALHVRGTLTVSAGTFTSTTNTLYVGTSFTVSSGATFTHNSGTVYFDQSNTGTITFPAGTLNFNNLTFACSVGKNIATNDTMVVNGVLSLLQNQVKGGVIRMVASSSLTQNAAFTGGTSQLEIKAALTINPTTTNFIGLIINHASAVVNAPASTISFNAPVTINAGTFNGGSNTININGDFSQTGGTFTATSGTLSFDKNFTYTAGTFNTNSGTVAFTSASGTTYTAGGKITFNNATLNKSSAGVVMTISSSDTLKANGTLTLTKGTTNGGYLQPLGNNGLSIAAGYTAGTSVMLVTGAINLTIAAGVNVPTLTLNNASATVNLSAGSSPVFYGAVTIYAGAFNCGSSTWNMTQNLNIQGGTFTASSDVITYGNNTLTIATGTTFNHNGGTFSFTKTYGGITVYNGAGAQFNNVTINLSDATASNARLTVNAGDEIVVEGSLTLQAGAIDQGVVELWGDLVDLGSFNGGTGQLSITNGSGARNLYLMSANQPSISINDANASVYAPSTQSLSVNGSFTLTDGEFFPDVYPVNFTNSFTQNGGNFWNGTNKITMSGNMNINDGNFYSTSDTLEIDGQNLSLGATATFDHNSGITYFNSSADNTTVTSTTKLLLYDVIVNLNNADANHSKLIVTTGDSIQTNGSLILKAGSLNTGVLEIAGDLTDMGSFQGGTGTFYFSENVDVRNLFLMSSAQPNIVMNDENLSLNTPTDKAVTFSGTFTLLKGDFFPYSYQAYPVTFDAAYTQSGGTFWNSTATVTMNAGATISGGTFTATSDVLEFGNSSALTIHTPGSFVHNDGTLYFTGGSNTVLSYDGGTLSLGNLEVGYSNAQLRPNCQLNMHGDLTIDASAALNMSTSGIDISIGGNFSDLNSSQGLVVGSRNVTLNGSSSQRLAGAVGEESFYKLTLANTSGGIHTINTDVYVYNQLAFTPASGSKIHLSDDKLTLDASATISGGSSTEYVVTDGKGSLRQNNIGASGRSGSIFFPVGNTAYNYAPVTLSNAGTNDRFDVRVAPGVWSNGQTGSGSPLNRAALNQTYFVEEGTVGGSNVTLTLQWNAADEFPGFDRSNCGIRHYTGGAWVKEGTDGLASGAGPYYSTASGITSFSPFDEGSDGGGGLPIELASFTGQLNDNGTVTIDWTTEIEVNNSYFTVERSIDGVNFTELGRQEGAGNSTLTQKYTMLDALPKTGVNYYRLKQTDFDGKFEYVGGIVAINTTKQSTGTISVYPNPVEGREVTIAVSDIETTGSMQVNVTDMTGKTVYNNTITGSPGYISLPSTIAPGIYMVKLTSGSNVYQEKLLVK